MTMQIKDIPENKTNTPAARLKAARENKGLTRKKLAELTGIPEKSIEKYEYGGMELNISRLKALCNALDIKPTEIIDIDDSSEKKSISEDENNPSSKSEKISTDTKNSLSEKLSHLKALDSLRENGFDKFPQKAEAHYNALKSTIYFLDYAELQKLAKARGIEFEIETSENIDDPVTKEYFEMYQGESVEEQPDLEELVNRIIDTAIFGVDFYSIDLEALSEMAEDYDLSPDRSLWMGWRGHREIAPQIRKAFLEKALSGQSEEDYLDTERFPKA
ncbi:MAG: helix-turn-helix domain-containing protein [Emcibacter sp.]|nr:helix-turn-helix domain-containing protein [Emcibacter sp.]